MGENEVVRCGLTPNLSLDLKHEGFSRSMEYTLEILSPYHKPLLLGFALNFLVKSTHRDTRTYLVCKAEDTYMNEIEYFGS